MPRSVERAFVWLGGALFVVALACGAWLYLGPLASAAPSPDPARALGVDVVLFTLFATHHSVLARTGVKRWIARLVPDRLIRSVYVWTASALLVGVSVGWQRIGGEIYRVAGVRAIAHALVQIAGVWLTVRSVQRIDPLELAGIRDAHAAGPGAGLQITGPYRFVRHPLYLGWMLMVFGAAHMTGDRLVFAAISSAYLLIAIPWEERSLRREFGTAYVEYERQVPWRVIPYVY